MSTTQKLGTTNAYMYATKSDYKMIGAKAKTLRGLKREATLYMRSRGEREVWVYEVTEEGDRLPIAQRTGGKWY